MRRGRLNTVFVDKKTIRKIGTVREKVRPYRLKVEAWALTQAESRGINVPHPIDYYVNKNGREVLVLERISGKHLSQHISKENAESMFKVGKQMNLLKDMPFGSWGWINPASMTGISKSWQSFLLLYIQTYHKLLIRNEILKKNQLQKVYDAIDSIDLSFSRPSLIHRDLRPGNIIKDDNREVWIVDWENAILGDPLYDIAIFGVRYGHDILWKNLIRGYGLDIPSSKYILTLYEAIGLVGLIDFYFTNKINPSREKEQLVQTINSI